MSERTRLVQAKRAYVGKYDSIPSGVNEIE